MNPAKYRVAYEGYLEKLALQVEDARSRAVEARARFEKLREEFSAAGDECLRLEAIAHDLQRQFVDRVEEQWGI